MIYGKEAQQVLPLNKPYGVEMSNGKIYVCDLRNGSVTVLDIKGRRVLVLGKTQADSLQTPTDIAVSPDGVKYVSDTGRGIIAVYGPDDRRINSFGRKDFKPVGVAVHGEDLYVCDFQAARVEVLNRRTGQFLRTIGEPGGEPGQFVRPLGISVDANGFVYVMDVMKCQLQKFDAAGKLVSNFGTITARAGGLVRPKHIDVDRDGTIYAVDAAFQNVQLFDQKGQVLTFFGTPGIHPGAMYLPAGVCVHEGDLELFKDKIHPAFQAERLVLVTNQFGPNKVSVYAMGHLRPGKTVQDIAASQGLIPTGVDDGKGKAAPVVAPSPEPGQVVGAGETGGGPAAAAPAAVGGRAAGPLTAADPPAPATSSGTE
jgi:DNA-binding beta-propeller fold protein YncE